MTRTQLPPPAVGSDAGGGTRRHLPALDGLRGAAALAVLVFHVVLFTQIWRHHADPLTSLLGGGFVGVDAFFVLSGFLLFQPVARRGSLGPMRGYAIRRAARIVPAYYLCLVGMVVLWPLFTRGLANPVTTGDGLLNLLVHALFLQQPVSMFTALDLPQGLLANPVFWTLSVEVSFYALLPLVAGWFVRRPVLGLAIAVTVQTAWRVLFVHFRDVTDAVGISPFGDAVYTQMAVTRGALIPGFAASFAFGMGAALVFERQALRPPSSRAGTRRWWLAFTATGALLVFTTWMLGAHLLRDRPFVREPGTLFFRYVGEPLVSLGFAALILLLLLAPDPVARVWNSRLPRRLGDWSYGIYLWQVPVIGFVIVTLGIRPEGTWSSFGVFLVLTTVGSVLLGAASHRFVERPFIERARAASGALRPGRPRS